MSVQKQIRRGTSAEHENFTGAVGEVTMDTTLNTLRVHDGQTPGGTVLARKSDVPDMGQVPHMIMPGTKTVDLTMTSNSTEFTAPADGYVYFSAFLDTRGAYIFIQDNESGMSTLARHFLTDSWESRIFMPVARGRKFTVGYGAMDRLTCLKFIYAIGAEE